MCFFSDYTTYFEDLAKDLKMKNSQKISNLAFTGEY